MSVKTKLGPTYFRSYNRSKVKVIMERTPTISFKIGMPVKLDLLVKMSIKAKLGPTYFRSYIGSKVEVIRDVQQANMADKRGRWRANVESGA